MFRGIVLFLKGVPKSIRKIAIKILPYSTMVLNALKSKAAITITDLFPGNEDEELRQILIKVLDEFNSVLQKAQNWDLSRQKDLAGRFAATAISYKDGRQHDLDTYRKCFDMVYQEIKAA